MNEFHNLHNIGCIKMEIYTSYCQKTQNIQEEKKYRHINFAYSNIETGRSRPVSKLGKNYKL